MTSNTELHNSAACCSTPVPQSTTTYTHKGSIHNLADTKCYIVGPTDAKKAIYFIYDVLGFHDATWQGADILASAGYLVIMPDFFGENAVKAEWMTLPDEKRKELLGGWIAENVADSKPHIEHLHRVLDAAKEKYSSVQSWGAIGFCWGGKMVSLTSGPETAWKAGVQSSPGRIDPADAAKTTIPMMMLASKDEPAADVKAFSEALTVPKHIETFDSQIHGWMSARADLEDEVVKKEFQRGYELAIKWFEKYI